MRRVQYPNNKSRPFLSLSLSEMDIIQGLSNLEIETTNSSSQKEEVKRNWLELPPDIMSMIFLKLDTVDILGSAQWVCSSWWKLSKQPHLFRSIVAEGSVCNLKLWRKMAREAIDRSCGELVEFSVGSIANDGLLHYMSEKSSSLRSLRLISIDDEFVTDEGLIEIAKKLPHLEELEIIQYYSSESSKDVIETFGRCCPQLESCRLHYVILLAEKEFYRVALAIAENMPELRHLSLFGNLVTSDDLRTILNGCPHLESLDLRQCFALEFAEDLKEWCKNIRVVYGFQWIYR